MTKKRLAVFTVLLLQIFFLSAMIFYHQAKLENAQKILLKTIPYDPLSIFRGTYASLSYEISSLPASLLMDVSPKELKDGDTLFVLLTKEQDYWTAEGIYKNRPKDNRLYLRGRLRYYYSYYSGNADRKLNLEYGIESFFLNEVRAKEVDRFNRWQGMNWEEREKEKDKRIAQLDEETQRIYKAYIDKHWFETLDRETAFWLKEGLINLKTQEAIINKYAVALKEIKNIEEEINSRSSSGQKPIIVEVAIDRNGNGSPLKLLIDSKEYR